MSSKPSKTKRAKNFVSNTKNKLKRSFDVFSSNKHEDKYQDLDDSDDDDDDDDGAATGTATAHGEEDQVINTRDQVVLIDSDEEQYLEQDKQTVRDEQQQQHNNKPLNELTDNTDFISLKFSDSEDESESELDNEQDAYDEDDDDSQFPLSNATNGVTPWIKDHDHSKQKEIADWLTMEIKDFIAYISPSKDEIETRNSAVRRLREAIEFFWKDCEVHVFGSYATDLYLPGSDIDMVIISNHGGYENRNSLYQLSSYLKRKNLATKVEVIAKAKVPIIKFTEAQSGIHIDVSFERTNGIDAAKTIREWLDQTPGLRELVLLIKQFLSARRLNDVHIGGLGGYSIICLVYSFLTLHPRLSTGNISPFENLGVLLIEFFELYGRNFGYDNVAICVEKDNVSYLNKQYYPDLQGRNPFSLAIQDPSDPKNNISRGSFNIRDIKKAFNGAYELLINTCYDLESATYKNRIGKSILGNIIKYRGRERDFNDERDQVVNEALYSDARSIVSQPIVYHEVPSSEEEEVVEVVQPPKKKRKTSEPKKKVEDLMGIVDSEDETPLKRTNSVDKDIKRDYWLQKGNAM